MTAARALGASLAFAVLPAALGCTSLGRPFDASHADDIRPGLDQATILEWFGEPFTRQDINGFVCKKRWIWYASPSQILFVDFDDSGSVCAR
jgi:hypothetical protein